MKWRDRRKTCVTGNLMTKLVLRNRKGGSTSKRGCSSHSPLRWGLSQSPPFCPAVTIYSPEVGGSGRRVSRRGSPFSASMEMLPWYGRPTDPGSELRRDQFPNCFYMLFWNLATTILHNFYPCLVDFTRTRLRRDVEWRWDGRGLLHNWLLATRHIFIMENKILL